MLIHVISDIHGSFTDLQRVLSAFAARKPDVLLVCGDFLNHGPRNPLPDGYNTQAVAALLNAHKERIICVRGNCDSEVDQMLLEFPCLNSYTTLFVPTAADACDAGEGNRFAVQTSAAAAANATDAERIEAQSTATVAAQGACGAITPTATIAALAAFRPNGRIFVHHGHRYDRAQLHAWLPAGSVVVSGHTHVTALEADGGLCFLNPGSISLPKCVDGKTCALIETDAHGIRKISLHTIDGAELRSVVW